MPELAVQRADQVLQVGAGLRVDRGERLVHEQHLGLVGDRAGDRHALLHAAGELPRVALGGVRRGRRPRALVDELVALGLAGGLLCFSGSSTLSAHASATGTGCGRTPGTPRPSSAAGR